MIEHKDMVSEILTVGIQQYANGDKYEGEWYDNKKNGKGVFYYANGDVYEAEWKNGKPEGKGNLS